MFLQELVNEAIATADSLEKEAFCGVVEEAGIVPGDEVVAVEDKAEGNVLNASIASKGDVLDMLLSVGESAEMAE